MDEEATSCLTSWDCCEATALLLAAFSISHSLRDFASFQKFTAARIACDAVLVCITSAFKASMKDSSSPREVCSAIPETELSTETGSTKGKWHDRGFRNSSRCGGGAWARLLSSGESKVEGDDNVSIHLSAWGRSLGCLIKGLSKARVCSAAKKYSTGGENESHGASRLFISCARAGLSDQGLSHAAADHFE